MLNTENIQTIPCGAYQENAYLVCPDGRDDAFLVDPGDGLSAIQAAINASGRTLSAILLTHGHYDHTGGVADLAEKWPGIPVYLNHRDQTGEDAYLRQLFPPIPGAKDYDEGDTIRIGSLTLTVLATPGHSEGSVTLRCGDVLFCGDTLFAGSCGRTDFPGGSTKKMMTSLKRLGELEGDFHVLPGHMEASTLDRERSWNPYLRQALNG